MQLLKRLGRGSEAHTTKSTTVFTYFFNRSDYRNYWQEDTLNFRIFLGIQS
jgi:hypothetical protein